MFLGFTRFFVGSKLSDLEILDRRTPRNDHSECKRPYLQSSYHCSTYLSTQPDLCSAPPATHSSSVVTLSLDHLHLLFWESPIAHFARHHLISGINILSHSASLAQNTLLMMSHSNSPPTWSPLSPSITHSMFHYRLKTHLFHKYFPP